MEANKSSSPVRIGARARRQARAACFPPWLALRFFGLCLAFFTCEAGRDVCVEMFGKPHECLENAVRAVPALRQQGGNSLAEPLGHCLQLLKLKS